MSHATLARRTLGGASLLVFAIGASSPLTVLVGGIVTMYALTGVTGTPLSFLVIAVVLVLLAVGYVAMARHVEHSAPFYAQLARGFNPAFGVAGAAVALLGYNAIQIALFALIGTTLAGLFGGAWWVWAAAAWLVVATLGRFRGAENAKLLGSLLGVEIATIILFDVAALAHPAEGSVSLSPLMPSSLLVTGVSGALAFAMACFTGVESPPAFGEEARSPRAVWWSTFGGIAFLGVLYALTAWAYAVATGPTAVAAAAQDPQRGPFAILERVYGAGMNALANLLLITSVFAALSAFHATVARYIFALGRERVLPPSWARVSGGTRGGAPLGGSLLQSLLAVVVVGVFALVGAEPMATMFVWLATIGAVCILVLLTASSLAARAFFRGGGGARESTLVRQVIPNAGGVAGVVVLVFMVSNLSSLLGTPPGSKWPWLVVAMVAVVALAGWAWGWWLRRERPQIYQKIGQGRPDPLTVLDQRLSDLEV